MNDSLRREALAWWRSLARDEQIRMWIESGIQPNWSFDFVSASTVTIIQIWERCNNA